jgi:hypothetical protein
VCNKAPKEVNSHHGISETTIVEKKERNYSIEFLNNFHAAQCWFSLALMVAAFTYGIFQSDMLVIFMLMPISLNGVLPIVLAYLHFVYHRESTFANLLLTMVTYTLNSPVKS